LFNKNTSDTDAKGFTKNKVTNIKQTWNVTNGYQDYRRMVPKPLLDRGPSEMAL